MPQVTIAFTDQPTSAELQTLAELAHSWASNHTGPIGLWFEGSTRPTGAGSPTTFERTSTSTKSTGRKMSQATRNKISQALRARHAQQNRS